MATKDNQVTIRMAAEDAFSSTFSALQNELTGMQAEWNKTAKSAETAMDKGVASMGKAGSEVKKAGSEVSTLGSLARDAAGTLAGLFALSSIRSFISSAVQASLAVDAINAKLVVATGSQAAADESMKFVSAAAKKLGLDLQSTAESYAAFAVATKGTTLEGGRARDIFMALSTAATALKLPAEATSRTFLQFQQMIAKGKVNMEDLKVASESGIVTFQQVADSLHITTSEMFKQMEAGKLMTNDVLPKLAEHWNKTFGPAAAEAAKGPLAQINNMKTELFRISATVGKDVSPVLVGIGTALLNIAKAVIGGWQLIAVQVGYSFDFMKTKMDLTLSPAETRKRLEIMRQAYDETVQEVIAKYGKAQDVIATGEKSVTKETEAQAVQRRAMARKSGDDLAKINLEYAKLVGDTESKLTAEYQKEYEERVKALTDFYDQKKAGAKDSQEELTYEQIKKVRLVQLERQHARDVEIIKVDARVRNLDGLKSAVESEAMLIEQQAVKGVMTQQRAEQQITFLRIAAAREQYNARSELAAKIAEIYGRDGETYKKALKDQEAAHKEYVSANLAAYKQYSGEIKRIDQEIVDYRASMQSKIADIQQRGMTEAAKYADNERRFNESISKARAALAQSDFDAAQKYNKQAEELAARLADKQAAGTTELEKQKAVKEGVAKSTEALNTVEKVGVAILESKKAASQSALDKLKELDALQLKEKVLTVKTDDSALAAVKAKLDELTATSIKTIIVKTTGSADASSPAVKGMATGGIVGGSGIGDTQLRMLDPREGVLRPEVMSQIGADTFHALNNPVSQVGRRLRAMINGSQPSAPAQMGTIHLSLGGGSFPVSAPVDVLSELTTAVRRLKMTRPQ